MLSSCFEREQRNSHKAKPHKSTNSQRLRQTVAFITYTDPANDSKAPDVKKFVNTWAQSSRMRPRCVAEHQPTALNSRMSDGGVKGLSSEDQLSPYIYTPSPNISIGGASEDPFDSLPLTAMSRDVRESLHGYLNYQPLSGSFGTLFMIIRRELWFPQMMESKAVFNSFVTCLHISRSATSHVPESGSSFRSKMQVALLDVRNEVSHPTQGSNDRLCFAVLLLLNAAYQIQDAHAMEIHFRGLVALLSTQDRLFNGNSMLLNAIVGWSIPKFSTAGNDFHFSYMAPAFPNRTVSRKEEIYLAGSMIGWSMYGDTIRPGNSPQTLPSFFLPSKVHVEATRLNGRARSFERLRLHGLITGASSDRLPYLLAVADLREQSNSRKLCSIEIAELLRLLWHNSAALAMYRISEMSRLPLEGPCFAAVMLFSTVTLRSDNRNLILIPALAGVVYQCLSNFANISSFPELSDVFLWLALLVGPRARLDVREWYCDLLLTARINLHIHTFEAAVQTIDAFLWSPMLNREARELWDEAQHLGIERLLYACADSIPDD